MDGQTEIMNKKLEEMIRAFVNHKQDNWDEHLVEFKVAYILLLMLRLRIFSILFDLW